MGEKERGTAILLLSATNILDKRGCPPYSSLLVI